MILQNKMISLPTYPNFFGPVTGTTGIFSFGLTLLLQYSFYIRTMQLGGAGGNLPPRGISSSRADRNEIPVATPMFSG